MDKRSDRRCLILVRAPYRIIVVVGVVYFLLVVSMYSKPFWLCILLVVLTLLFLAIGLLVTAIVGFTKWRRLSRLWMMPALVCLAFILSAWFAPPMGRFIADWEFRRHLVEYVRVVDDVR